MGAVESLAAWGIVRPAEVVELARSVNLPLALAASLLEQESAGGHNVWGHDAVATGGYYVKGAEVTQAAYANYADAVRAGHIGRQGCGPCQLTAATYQDLADRSGGCWDWRANVKVGFGALASLVQQYGLADGVRRYNGSGPAAEAYRDQVLGRYRTWSDRLGSSEVMTVPADPGGSDGMALNEADFQKLIARLLATPLPDYYPDKVVRTMTFADVLAWACANAGRAETQAQGARADIAALSAKLDALAATVASLGGPR